MKLIFPEENVDSWSQERLDSQFRELQHQGRIEFVTFHQSYGYEEFVEGIRPLMSTNATDHVRYELHPGIFKRISLRAAAEGLRTSAPANPEPNRAENVQSALDRPEKGTVVFKFTNRTRPYVLIIDEINRGNISKILGELITLLEPDKRLGLPNELKLPLAYSPQHRFAVPPNLHIIGTMNTADRSIALMDVALRRRFRFEEVPPQLEVIRSEMKKQNRDVALIDLVCELFDAMNQRIRMVLDRDHQLGHAYFLNISSLQELRVLFTDRVIPLLQEYFHGSLEKVCVVLGCPYDEDGIPLRSGPCVNKSKYRAPIIKAVNYREGSVNESGYREFEKSLELHVSEIFKSIASQQVQKDRLLLEYFLGILHLDQDGWNDHINAFETSGLISE